MTCTCADASNIKNKDANIFIEIWVGASKFILEIPSRSEDINKVQTEFARRGMQPPILQLSTAE